MQYLLLMILMIFVVDQRPAQAGAAAMMNEKKKAMMEQQGAMMQGMTPQQQQQYLAMQQEMQATGAGQMNPQEFMQQRMMQQQAQAQEPAQDVADIKDVINALSQSARDWTLIIDKPAKDAVVSFFIAQFQNQRTIIRKPASYYASMIDTMAQTQPAMLNLPLPNILEILAVVDYDFDNGQNKDAMAMKILKTQDAVMKNRQRLGMP